MPPGRRDSKADGVCIPFKLSMILRIAQDKSVVCNGTLKVHASSCTNTSAVSSLLEATEGANNARIHIAAVIVNIQRHSASPVRAQAQSTETPFEGEEAQCSCPDRQSLALQLLVSGPRQRHTIQHCQA